jgi:hypothetical protein
VVPEGGGENVGKGCRRVNMLQYCVHMYVNGKMRLIGTLPRMGKGDKENDREGEFKYNIFDIL